MNRRTLLQITAVAALTGASCGAFAQGDFPTRPITLVVPFSPGGTVDIVARTVSEKLGQQLGQPIIIDNRAGAATIIAADYVQKAAPDGYTLLIGTSTTFVVNPIIYPKIPYDSTKSFEPIGVIGSSGLALLANSNVKANTVQELISEIRAKPDSFAYGSHGNGSTVHFAAEMLWSAAKLHGVVHIPYKGSAPAITDLLGGQIPLAFDAIPAASSAAKGNRIKILAVTGEKRSPLLPSVPTIAESGYPGFKMTSWFGIVAPKNLPVAVRDRLEKALQAAIADPALVKRLQDVGFDPQWSASSKYSEMVKADTAILAPIAKASNITATN
ncbi:Bug family tripartite tricarboxylate transporter substrate binding protein [Variovorax ginsengisoli]|uniref:Tripartite-type tricarboxylate transporter receptor subunit TctC n=1 Tax=Variovorax ginsengisoli TaxID=363844 RepID=A0ABT9SCK1_9BURK|nr:tripartite tricarboxylate transporter substrate binding protein [Variovorax ginsengisoli]MDP9901142.1 tripartite-type tricarboxylate transporter receptor subunit TctC [Variovorax ginsengisoli]